MIKVICGIGGTGKTELAKNDSRFIDLDNSDYQWIFDKNIVDDEKRKGSKGIPNPDFPNNYIKDIKKYIAEDKCILCGARLELLEMFNSNNIDFLLVIPSYADKEIYRQRYINRGNEKYWYENYLNSWKKWYEEYQKRGYKILLMDHDSYISEYADELLTFVSSNK